MQDNNKPPVCDRIVDADKPAHLQHNAPLRWLVKHLHGERTLRDNVVRLRYKRRRPAAAKPVEEVQP